ncbi:MAG TPA: FHA domain-containing protein, partial [Minicystis sp.]|nr:FHA domain-containing protein [Minicystis sp.]
FEGEHLVVGRAESCAIRVDDGAASQRHASVSFRAGAWILEDLGSSNGTLVDGRRIDVVALRPGALVMIGNTLFKFLPAGVESHAHYDLEGRVVGKPFDDDDAADDAAQRALLVGGYRMHRLARALSRLAASRVTVTLAGEPGTEKPRAAELLHRYRGAAGAFLPLRASDGDKGALAFTVASRLGEIGGGTVFVDDADALTPPEIASIERMLETAAPPGAPRPGLVLGVRNAPPDASEAARYALRIPPLRERKEDLYALTRAALAKIGRRDLGVEFLYLVALAHYDFPANVEELDRIVESSAAASTGGALGKDDVPHVLRVRMAHARRAR